MNINQLQYKLLIRRFYRNKSIIKEMDGQYGIVDWEKSQVVQFFSVKNKTGLILLKGTAGYYVGKFSKIKLSSNANGQIMPVICDLCFTRIPGSKSARIRLERTRDNHFFSWLVCSDLSCGLNVRELTQISLDSKRIIGENIPVDKKVNRLQKHIDRIIQTLELEKLEDIQ